MSSGTSDEEWLVDVLQSRIAQSQVLEPLPFHGPAVAKRLYIAKRTLEVMGRLSTQFEADVKELKYTQLRLRNDSHLVPANELPDEVLSEIFACNVPRVYAAIDYADVESAGLRIVRYQKLRQSIGLVCVRWARALKHTPACWSVIKLDLSRPDVWNNRLETELQRSGREPLSLVIYQRKSSGTNENTVPKCMAALTPYLTRCYNLCMEIKSPAQLKPLGALPNLRFLWVTTPKEYVHPEGAVITLPNSSPQSIIVKDHDIFRASVSIVSTGVADITHLHLNAEISPLQLLNVLRNSTQLAHLRLCTRRRGPEAVNVEDTITLPNLKSLALEGRIPSGLKPVDAPRLETLDPIGINETQEGNAIINWIENIPQYPSLLSLLLPQHGALGDLLPPLVKDHPTLRELYLPLAGLHALDARGGRWVLSFSGLQRLHIGLNDVQPYDDVLETSLRRLLERSTDLKVTFLTSTRLQRDWRDDLVADFGERVFLTRNWRTRMLLRNPWQGNSIVQR